MKNIRSTSTEITRKTKLGWTAVKKLNWILRNQVPITYKSKRKGLAYFYTSYNDVCYGDNGTNTKKCNQVENNPKGNEKSDTGNKP